MSEGRDDGQRGRPSIEERVARREQVDALGRDRYDTLLRHLRAGQEMQVEARRRERLDWHPIAGKLLLAALVVVAAYVAVSTGLGIVRENRVDQWSGPPDMAVTSGQKLDDCPSLYRADDPVFPNWIRFGGALFMQADAVVPVGDTNIGSSYLDTGYTLDKLRIYTVHVSGLGEPGSRLAVRQGDAPGSEIYRRVDECS